MSTPPCNTSSANGDNPLNFVSHSRGSLQITSPPPFPLIRPDESETTPDLASNRTTPALLHQLVTIREKSAGEILVNLKGITLSYQFHETVEALYLGRWTLSFPERSVN